MLWEIGYNAIDEKRNVQKMHIANSDKSVSFYSLDVILAVGYRANSGRAIKFRQWATKTLRSHIVDGYTINKKRLAKNYDAFLKVVEQVKTLLPSRRAGWHKKQSSVPGLGFYSS